VFDPFFITWQQPNCQPSYCFVSNCLISVTQSPTKRPPVGCNEVSRILNETQNLGQIEFYEDSPVLINAQGTQSKDQPVVLHYGVSETARRGSVAAAPFYINEVII
jgi:hypothetical protein